MHYTGTYALKPQLSREGPYLSLTLGSLLFTVRDSMQKGQSDGVKSGKNGRRPCDSPPAWHARIERRELILFGMRSNKKARRSFWLSVPLLLVLLILRFSEYGLLMYTIQPKNTSTKFALPTSIIDPPQRELQAIALDLDPGMAFSLESIDTNGLNWNPTSDQDTLICMNLHDQFKVFKEISKANGQLWTAKKCTSVLLPFYEQWYVSARLLPQFHKNNTYLHLL